MFNMSNIDRYNDMPHIKELLANFWDNKAYDINISDLINQYDSELLEKSNYDILTALNTLTEKELTTYILTDDILYEIAYHLLNYDIYKDDNWTVYLELSDRRVFAEITIEIMRDEILAEVNDWIKWYENDVRIKYSKKINILQLWRSGKHICIPLTIEWILIYNTLIEEYKTEEDRFISYINWDIED